MAYQYSCDEDPFQIRSEDRDEVIDYVREHAQEKHGMSMDRDDVESGIQEV